MKVADRELATIAAVGIASAAGRTSEAAYLGKKFVERLAAFVDQSAELELPDTLRERLPELAALYASYADAFDALHEATRNALELIPSIKAPT